MIQAENYIGLVKKIAMQFQRCQTTQHNKLPYTINDDLDNLIQWGMCGLCKAIKSFNPDKCPPEKFGIYAIQFIKLEIFRGYSNDRLIHIPHDVCSVAMQICSEKITIDDVRNTKAYPNMKECVIDALAIISLQVSDYSTLKDIEDPLIDESNVTLLSTLSDKQALALEYSLGLDGGGRRTSWEVAALMGTTPGNARGMVSGSLKKLKSSLSTSSGSVVPSSLYGGETPPSPHFP